MLCHSPRVCSGLLFLGLFALAAGCTPSYKARATVKGKVTFAGKALTTGSVMFYGKNNITGSASIDKDGNYVMNDAPLGDVTITVSAPVPPPEAIMRRGGPRGKAGKESKSVNPENPSQSIPLMPAMPSRFVPIPEKYAKPETSGLTYKVEKGEQTHDITLTP
jgi:hypothetical protein